MMYTTKSLMGNDAPFGREAVSRHGGAACRVVRQPWPRAEWGFGVVVRHPLGSDVAEMALFNGTEQPIDGCQLRSLHRAIQDAQLVTERQDLELQGRAAVE